MLSNVYTIVLWANFCVKLLMSSAKNSVNSFDECNVFEKAAQLSVIVYDNKRKNSNDVAFSVQSVTVDLDTTNLFILIALVCAVFVFVVVSPAEYQRK